MLFNAMKKQNPRTLPQLCLRDFHHRGGRVGADSRCGGRQTPGRPRWPCGPRQADVPEGDGYRDDVYARRRRLRPHELLVKAPNKTRLLMTIDLTSLGAAAMTVEQRFDGTAVYAINSMQGETPISAKQVENMRNGIFPTPLLGYKERGAKLEQAPNEKVQGKDAIVLVLTPATGSPVRMFLDPETYLVVRTATTVNSAQLGGDVQQTTELSDYRTSTA